MKQPNNRHGKSRRRNDGALVKLTIDTRQARGVYPFVNTKATPHHIRFVRSVAQGVKRAGHGRYVWNPVVRFFRQWAAQVEIGSWQR